jgi:hypothetical protein
LIKNASNCRETGNFLEGILVKIAVGGLLLKKLIDKHGKLWGLINPVDLAVIIILFALGIKVFSDYRPVPLDFKENQITVGLLVKNIPLYLADSITVGQDVFQDGSNAYLGKIKATRVEPAELLLENNGAILLRKSPRNLDLRLVLKNRGRIIMGPARSGVYLGKFAVRVGDHLKAHTLYSSMSSEIEYLKVNGNGR